MLIVNLGGRYSVWAKPYDARFQSYRSQLFFQIELEENAAREYLSQRMGGLFAHETPAFLSLFVEKATEQFMQAMRSDRQVYTQYRHRKWSIEPKQLFLFEYDGDSVDVAMFNLLVDHQCSMAHIRKNARDIRKLIVDYYPNLQGVTARE